VSLKVNLHRRLWSRVLAHYILDGELVGSPVPSRHIRHRGYLCGQTIVIRKKWVWSYKVRASSYTVGLAPIESEVDR
jgi:hypothetical protein